MGSKEGEIAGVRVNRNIGGLCAAERASGRPGKSRTFSFVLPEAQAPRDVEALADLICRVAALLDAVPKIAEIDLNSVFVHAAVQGISLADARILMKDNVQE